jgi:hypothetical protein
LGGVFIAAALALILVAGTSVGDRAGDGLEPNWSSWQPTDTSLDGGAAQIAEKVGAEYRHPDGKQLTLVTGRRLDADVALRSATGEITRIDDPGVVYKLDGLGPNGSILGGTPSAERLKIVRRQALELALYTFRYLPDVEQVVTLLPPPPPAANQASTTSDPIRNAVFYRPGDLKAQLQMPLGLTLPDTAPTADTLSGVEAATIDLLTSSNVFKWSLPDPHSALLVLDR